MTFQQVILAEINRSRAARGGCWPLSEYSGFTKYEFFSACNAVVSVRDGRHLRAFREREAERVERERPYAHIT